MYRCNTEETARAIATRESLAYGLCVFDGKWYVGTQEQLAKIGVVIRC